jgi:hypothetical protein
VFSDNTLSPGLSWVPSILSSFFAGRAVLGLEFRASCLLDFARQALDHLSHSTSPIFVLGFFQDTVSRTICLRLASNLHPPDLCLSSL